MRKISDLKIEYAPIDSLVQHPHNPRQGDVGAILQSVEAHGLYAPVVVQRSTRHIIKGNHTAQAAKLDGVTEMPVVFVDVDDDQALRILLADNQVGDQATNDTSILTDLLESLVRSDLGLEGTGFTGDDVDDLLAEFYKDSLGLVDSLYTKEVNIPQYAIVGECPDLEDLYDDNVAVALQERVANAQIPPDVQAFLRLASYRHDKFDYRKVAEYYAHALPEVQALIEDSALVIIDYDDAIAKGYVTFRDTINDLRQINA